MLAIRLQRKGRKGDAFYRIIVQNSQRHPKSGSIINQLGTFNPHTKEAVIDKDQAKTHLDNGAQPSNRVAQLLKAEGVKLPKWVTIEKNEKREIRNPDKLRKNQPQEAASKSDDGGETEPAAADQPGEDKKSEEKAESSQTAEDSASK